MPHRHRFGPLLWDEDERLGAGAQKKTGHDMTQRSCARFAKSYLISHFDLDDLKLQPWKMDKHGISKKTLDSEGSNNFRISKVKGHAPICLLKRWTGFIGWFVFLRSHRCLLGVGWRWVCKPWQLSVGTQLSAFGSSKIGGAPRSLFR